MLYKFYVLVKVQIMSTYWKFYKHSVFIIWKSAYNNIVEFMGLKAPGKIFKWREKLLKHKLLFIYQNGSDITYFCILNQNCLIYICIRHTINDNDMVFGKCSAAHLLYV